MKINRNNSPFFLKEINFFDYLNSGRVLMALLFCTAMLTLTAGFARAQDQSRISHTIDNNWQFYKGDTPFSSISSISNSDWKAVSLPHTWNAKDAFDDKPGYYRGPAWYHKTLNVPSGWKDKEVYLYFEGADQQTEVYVNGKEVGTHIGGYTRFCFPISSYLKYSDSTLTPNQIYVKVDNSYNNNIPPLSADFTFYGGIYRDVYVKVVNKVHFSLSDYASNGVFLTTPKVSAEKADVVSKSIITNDDNSKERVRLVTTIFNEQNDVVQKQTSNLKLKSGENTIEQTFKSIANPHLWSPDHPYLYRVVSRIYDRHSGKVIDEISNPLGFRWFKFDANNGFFLNGKHVKLIGANRHQDYVGMGNAVPEHLQIRDIKMLKRMGANFIRISHYPQDPVILQTCDRLGIIASVEIPIVNRITETDAFSHNCEHMMTEMIRQNFNHPSVLIWAYMNEVLLVPRFRHDPARQKIYFKHVKELAEQLNSLARKEDPYRYTMIPFHDSFDIYYKTGMTSVPMIDGWNQYEGWYGKDITGLQRFLDRAHKLVPDKPIFVTEYGAGADPRLHSFHPERFDFTVEYQTYYHKYYLKQIMARPFVSGSSLWNLSDFGSEGRGDAVPHINNKGMLGYNRVPKATYYFYQSKLLKKPYVKIASRQWKLRGGIAQSDEALYCTQPVKVFTNQKNVDLSINGKDLGSQVVDSGVVVFQVPFSNGVNKLVATSTEDSKTISDNATITFHLEPAELDSKKLPFQSINVSLGSKRYFSNEKQHQIWLPDQEYQSKSWGSIGGETYVMPWPHNEPYGTDRNILGTNQDPIYQTQKVGIKSYRLDVPDGVYTVKLYFAEINYDSTRTFDVSVNGTSLIQNLNLYKEYGPFQSVSFKTHVITQNGQGIQILFKPVTGEPVLNALSVRKIR